VGAIFRTADAAGASKIYLSGYTPVLFNPKTDKYESPAQRHISKTALGAEKTVEWKNLKNLSRLLKQLKQEKFKIYALEKTGDSEDIFLFKPKFPCVLILGNEVCGIDRKVLKSCDAVLGIPMRGKKESLNVAVAAGIAMYQILS
jgi:23S rRNA (guanosine2251-2'-O)-methyltransferase